MPTRINQSQVQAFVFNTLMSIRAGLNEALAQGIVVEIPEKVDFQLEIVPDGLTMTTTTTNESNNNIPAKVKITDQGAAIDTTVEAPVTDSTTEAAALDQTVENPVTNTLTDGAQTNTVTDTRTANQTSQDSGQDAQDVNYTYTSKTT